MDKDSQLIFETYLNERVSTSMLKHVGGTEEDSKNKYKDRVHDEVKKAAERVDRAGTDELTKAEKRKIKELEDVINKKSEGMSKLDKAQIALDVGGLASLSPEPIGQVTGVVSDTANATISLARGVGSAVTGDTDNVKKHFANMGLSMLGLVPYIGDAAAAGLKAGRLSKGGKVAAFGKGTAKQFATGVTKGTKASKAAKNADLGRELGHIGLKVGKGKSGAKAGREVARRSAELAREVEKGDRARKKAARLAGAGGALFGRERPENAQGPIIDVPAVVSRSPEELNRLSSGLKRSIEKNPALLDTIRQSMQKAA